MKNNKSIYLAAFYYLKPAPGVNTSVKGWMNDSSNIRYDERVEITRGLKNNCNEAKIILDLSQKTIQKNGWNDAPNFDELFKYFFTGYHQYITQIMTKLDAEYFNQMLDEMQAEIDTKKEKDILDVQEVQAQ